MRYKEVVGQIRDLNWEALHEPELERLMHISHGAAREFAASLRVGMRVYKSDPNLQEMARGELKTSNLEFGDYAKRGDHSEFLEYFLAKHGMQAPDDVEAAVSTYTAACEALPDDIRAKSVFSREAELSGIFRKILRNTHWSTDALKAFQYYLDRHVQLDTQEGGHADLVAAHAIGDEVLPFYEARLQLYRVIPELFTGA